MKKTIAYICVALAILIIVPVGCAFIARSVSTHAVSAGKSVGSVAKKYISALSPEKEEPSVGAFAQSTSEQEGATPSSARGRYIYLVTAVSEQSELRSLMLLTMESSDGSLRVIELPKNAYLRSGESSVHSPAECFEAAAKSEPRHAERRLVHFVKECTGIPIDGYFSFPTEALPSALDAVGGVSVALGCDLSMGTPDSPMTLKKGKHTLDGKLCAEALESPDADRAHLCSKLLFAIGDKLRKDSSLPRLISLYNALAPSLRTDMSFGQMLNLSPVFMKGCAKKTEVVTLTGEEYGVYRSIDTERLQKLCK